MTSRQLTHHDECWLDGPEHYMCAIWKLSQLTLALENAASLISDTKEREKFEEIALDTQEAMLMTNYRE